MDRQIATGLGISTQEYVTALLGKRIQTEHLKPGTVIDGVKLSRSRVIFPYQDRSTYLDLDE